MARHGMHAHADHTCHAATMTAPFHATMTAVFHARQPRVSVATPAPPPAPRSQMVVPLRGWMLLLAAVAIAGAARAGNLAGMAARDRLLAQMLPADAARDVLDRIARDDTKARRERGSRSHSL